MEKKQQLPGHLIVTAYRDRAVEAEIERQRGFFLTEKLDEKRMELGDQEFEKQRAKLTREAEQQWEQLQKAKAALRELEERMNREIMDFAPLEKAYRAKFEAEGCSKEMIEKTLQHRRSDFERAQGIVKERFRPQIDPDQDFRQRVLNPATRREAVERYLINHIHKTHFLTEAFNLIFEELDKRRRR